MCEVVVICGGGKYTVLDGSLVKVVVVFIIFYFHSLSFFFSHK